MVFDITGGYLKHPAFHQGGTHYHWERDETYGMIERSRPLEPWRNG